MALFDNCVAAYKLSDTSDATGRGNTLTNNNGVTFPSGGIGNYAEFNGTNQSLSIADNTDLSPGDIDLCIGFRFWLDTKATTQALVGKWINTGTDVEYAVWYNHTLDRVRFTVNDFAGLITANTFGAVPTGQWITVLAWHDSVANTLNLKINNAAETPVSYSGGIPDTGQAFRLGADNEPVNFLDGRLDAVHVWKKVPSAQDQTDFWNGGAGIEFNLPVANAGQDQTRMELETVTLDSSRSIDAVSRLWEQVSGTAVTLINPTEVYASFVAPDISTPENLVFKVTVENAAELTAEDQVTIRLVPTGSTEWLSYVPREVGMQSAAFYAAFDALPSPSIVACQGRLIAAKGDVTLEGYTWSASKALTALIAARQIHLNNIEYSDTIPGSDSPTGPLATLQQFLSMTSDYGLSPHSPGDFYAYNNASAHHYGTHLKTTFYAGLDHVQTLQSAYVTALDFEDTLTYNAAGFMSGWDGGWHMSTRDLARIAQLVLQRGVWEGTQILDYDFCANGLWIQQIPEAATQSTSEPGEFFNQVGASAVMKDGWSLGFWLLEAGASTTHESVVMQGKFGTSVFISREKNLIAVACNVGGTTDDTLATKITGAQFDALADATPSVGTGPALFRGRNFSLFDDEEVNRFEFWPAVSDSAPVVLTVPVVTVSATAVAPSVLLGSVTQSVPAVTVNTSALAPQITLGTLTRTVPNVTVNTSAVAPAMTVGSVSITVPVVTVTSAATTPVVTAGAVVVVVPVATVTAAAFAPSVDSGLLVTVPAVSVAVTATAPSVVLGAVSVAVPSVTVSSQAVAPPVLLGAVSLTVPTATVTTAVTAPIIPGGPLAMDVVTVSVSATAPVITLGTVSLSVPVVSLSIQVVAPLVPHTAVVPVVSVGVSAVAPGVLLSPVTVSAPAITVTITAVNPSITLGTSVVSVGVASVGVVVEAPGVSTGAGGALTVPVVGVQVSTVAPSVLLGTVSHSVPVVTTSATAISPNVALGALSRSAPIVDVTSAAVNPTVAPGTVALSVPVVSVQTSAIAPSITSNAPPVDVPTVDIGVSAVAPSVTLGAATHVVPVVGVSITVSSPAVIVGSVSVAMPVANLQVVVVSPYTVNVGPAFSAVLTVESKPIAEISVQLKPSASISRWT